MSSENGSDPEWAAWLEVQRAATLFWMQGEASAAVAAIDHYLEEKPRVDLSRQAIGFRGSIHEDQGDLEAAKNDFVAANGLSENDDFERYTLLVSLGEIAERRGVPAEADSWYVAALRTAASDPKTSGASALLRLVRLRGREGLTDQERFIAEKVMRQGWSLLRVAGEPDMGDLVATATRLLEAQKRPLSAS